MDHSLRGVRSEAPSLREERTISEGGVTPTYEE